MTQRNLQQDWKIRVAAIKWVRKYSMQYGDRVVHSSEMRREFFYEGENVKLMRQHGIFRPRQCALPLSIMTSYRNPYSDSFEENLDFMKYHYEDKEPGSIGNSGMRTLCELRWPLIYFHGIESGYFQVFAPVLVCANRPDQRFFGITLGDMQDMENMLEADSQPLILSSAQQRYKTQKMKVRLEQGEFRSQVLRAYSRRCSLCRLGHKHLLDAAHIKPYREDGPSEISNGLTLCKLHHAAYDNDFLGISPDHKIIIRRDILREKDGPTLQHSLKELHEGSIRLPRSQAHQPSRDFLAERFEKFQVTQRDYN